MANTAVGMIVAVGQQVTLRVNTLHVECKVLDVKHVWGKERVLITPVSGGGEQWVELSSLVRR